MNDQYTDILTAGRQMVQMGGLYLQAERQKASGDYVRASEAFEAYRDLAREHIELLLAYNQRHPESPYEIQPTARTFVNVLMTFADVLEALGRSEEAEASRDEASRISHDHLGASGSADTKRARAASLILQGRFNAAISALMDARDVIREEGDYVALARVTLDLADVLQWLGDFQRADEEVTRVERLLQPALEKGRPTKKDVLSDLLSSMSSIMQGHGDPGTAERSANLYRAATEVVYYRGLITRARRDWELAEQAFNQVLPDYRDLGVGEAIEWQLAQIMVGREEYSAALRRLERLEPTFETAAFRPKRGVLRRSQAECLFKLGRTEVALSRVQESVADLTGSYFDPDALWRSQWLEAQIRNAADDRPGALDRYREAIETVMNLRRAPLGYRLDSTFLEDKEPLYREAIGAALDAGALEDCCRFLESLKSRTLAAVLSTPPQDETAEDGLAVQFEEVTRSLDALEYQIYSSGDRDSRRKRRDLLQTRGDLLERIRISDPRWHTLSEPVVPDLAHLQERLAERAQAALTLYYDPPNLTAILVTGNGLRGGRIAIEEKLSEDLADFALNLQKSHYDPFKNDFSDFYGVSVDDLIPPDLLGDALNQESLVIIPHGVLHLVPWAGLTYEDGRLFERIPVAISPNLGLLAASVDERPPRTVGIIGVASYKHLAGLEDLASVEHEVADVSSVYEASGAHVLEPLINDAATEAAFWRLGDQIEGAIDMLHVSCHGVMIPAEPMNSGLLLSDSKVDAAEVARSRLPFRDVVLSACSTGWRPCEVQDVVLRADEVLGIPAGFLEAGARTVLVSIPKAQGGAAHKLVHRYHTHRVAGRTPMFALREAQRDMLEAGVHVGNWVGFTLYGFH